MMNKSTKMILVTGLARSGTTLLSDCLDHHPQIMCIADPMNEFFKGFMRYAYYHVEKERKSVGYPIDNFFFSGSKRVSQFIDETDLNHQIPGYLRNEIIERMILRDGEYCPEIIEPLKDCQAESFDSLFLEIIQLLYDIYGKPGTLCFGVKTAWCEQLLKPLAKTFPNMTFVNIIRDPRAVIASNYKAEGARFPLFFNVRDWRKSVYYNWKYQYLDPTLSNRFIGVRYEDLIADSDVVLSKITDLIGVEFSETMVNSTFKQSNTSYEELKGSKGINAVFKDKWKEVLPEEIVLQTEVYCGAEMDRLEYTKMYPDSRLDREGLMRMKDIPYESLSGWCKELVQGKKHYEEAWHVINIYLEAVRLTLISDEILTENEALLEEFFYHRNFYLWLRNDATSQFYIP